MSLLWPSSHGQRTSASGGEGGTGGGFGGGCGCGGGGSNGFGGVAGGMVGDDSVVGAAGTGVLPTKSSVASFQADDPYCRLWVGHIPRYMDEAKLKTAVGKHGAVKRIHIMESKVDNGLLAAFVTTATPSDAARVITGLHLQRFHMADERELLVRLQYQ